MHYSGGFLIWLKKIIQLNPECLGNKLRVVPDSHEFDIIETGEHKCIVNINGVLHILSVKPLNPVMVDSLLERGGI